jgi:hypothetical protein
MSTLIHPQAMTIDGLSIRFAEGGKGIERKALTRRLMAASAATGVEPVPCSPRVSDPLTCHIRTDCM